MFKINRCFNLLLRGAKKIKDPKFRKSKKQIAQEFDIPRQTLTNHILRPSLAFTPGPNPSINEEETKGLVAGIIIIFQLL